MMEMKSEEELHLEQSPAPKDLNSSVNSSPHDTTMSSGLVPCSSQAGDSEHSTTLLHSELCESVLTHPDRYLDGVPIFGMDEGEEAHHTHIPTTNIDLAERIPILEPTDMGSTGFDAQSHQAALDPGCRESTECPESPQGQLKIETLPEDTEDSVEPKDAKMELLNSVPFLVSEEGVLFQCFPLSEKEMIIMSVNDNSLLVNDSITNQIPTSDSASNATTSKYDSIISVKEDSMLKLPTVSEISSQQSDPSSIILSSAGITENDENLPSCSAPEVSQSSGLPQISLVSHIDLDTTASLQHDSLECHDDNSSGRKIRSKTVPAVNEVTRENGMKVTHATIYAPAPRKMKGGGGEGEEQGGSDCLRCHLCSDTLPSLLTLRHHLVVTHNQADIKSYKVSARKAIPVPLTSR